MDNARFVAFELLERVQRDDSYVNLLLPSILRKTKLPEVDRGLVQEMAYGALRWQLQYDTFMDHLANQKSIDIQVRLALRLGLHQLFRMRVPSHAAINETVELVKRVQPRAAGFTNAILRNADRTGIAELLNQSIQNKSPQEAVAIRYSHPQWVIAAISDAMELDGRTGVEAILEANNETPEINIAALSDASRRRLEETGLAKSEISPIGFIATGNPEPLLDHETRVQDQGSQLVALTLLKLAKGGGKFLDMCSGPGGKAAVLQAGMSADSTLLCLEPTLHRAKMVEDALHSDSRARVEIRTGQSAESQSYDAVLLDAPCSGIGSLRRKPESRWRKLPSQLAQLNRTQHELLSVGLDSLKPGGVLLYSTCSPVISETNSQVAHVLETRSDCELVDIKPALLELSPSLHLNPDRKTVQLWTDLHQTDCMFLAAFRKR